MGFDYVLDTFRKRSNVGSRYAAIETKAIELLCGAVNGHLTLDELDSGLLDVNKQMVEAEKNEAVTVIDEHYPMWLVQLLANKYRQWHMWRLLYKIHNEHPDKFSDPSEESDYQRVCAMNYDDNFMEVCKYCLRELEQKTNK